MTTTETNEQQEQSQSGGGCGNSNCLCGGTGPTVSAVAQQMMKQFGPSEPVKRHFANARLEILKGLRAMLDARISDLQNPGPARGTKLNVD
ncbi:MAG: hypothetical protein IT162_16015 [Bryobacterales bacterium]|nr:hypothetical protein [Bryobacterales bacterium]